MCSVVVLVHDSSRFIMLYVKFIEVLRAKQCEMTYLLYTLRYTEAARVQSNNNAVTMIKLCYFDRQFY